MFTVGLYQSMADGQDEDGRVHKPREKLPRYIKNAAMVHVDSSFVDSP